MNISPSLSNLLVEKARKSPTAYKISAVAFDKHGDILGHSTCSISIKMSLEEYRHQCSNKCCRSGLGEHAERRLMKRYGSLIKTIVICRVGASGEMLSISPCKMCSKVANKLGIKIISIKE